MAHGRADARARGFCGACTHIRKVILDAVDLVHAALRRAGGRGSDGGRNLRREGVGSGVRRAGMVAAVLVHSVSSRRSSIGPCRTLTASAFLDFAVEQRGLFSLTAAHRCLHRYLTFKTRGWLRFLHNFLRGFASTSCALLLSPASRCASVPGLWCVLRGVCTPCDVDPWRGDHLQAPGWHWQTHRRRRLRAIAGSPIPSARPGDGRVGNGE